MLVINKIVNGEKKAVSKLLIKQKSEQFEWNKHCKTVRKRVNKVCNFVNIS